MYSLYASSSAMLGDGPNLNGGGFSCCTNATTRSSSSWRSASAKCAPQNEGAKEKKTAVSAACTRPHLALLALRVTPSNLHTQHTLVAHGNVLQKRTHLLRRRAVALLGRRRCGRDLLWFLWPVA